MLLTCRGWDAYSTRFGWSILEPICNPEAAASYITKYITKDVARSVTELNAHMYYSSHGLNRAVIMAKQLMYREIDSSTFSNEYVTVKDFYSKVEAIKYLNEVSYG